MCDACHGGYISVTRCGDIMAMTGLHLVGAMARVARALFVVCFVGGAEVFELHGRLSAVWGGVLVCTGVVRRHCIVQPGDVAMHVVVTWQCTLW
jgi:hypothetical protein